MARDALDIALWALIIATLVYELWLLHRIATVPPDGLGAVAYQLHCQEVAGSTALEFRARPWPGWYCQDARNATRYGEWLNTTARPVGA